MMYPTRLLFSLVLFAMLILAPAGPAWTPVCLIQGIGWSSPLQEKLVTTRGVVFADFDQASQKGFYIQEPDCDGNPSTSDGLFVYLGERVDVVQAGDRVEVSGTVQEYYGMTELLTAPAEVTVLSQGKPLPPLQELAPPFNADAARQYFEQLEGMYAGLAQGRVVGPTDADDRTWLVRDDLGIGRVFPDDPAGSGEIVCVDDAGLFEITPEVKTGQQVQGLAGALDYRLGDFCLELTAAPQLVGTVDPAAGYPPAPGLRLATWNLGDLFDPLDDPATDDSVLSGAEYARRLEKRAQAIRAMSEPALVGVQEAENLAVLHALAARPELQSRYGAVLLEGIDRRGIDVGLLYRIDQLALLESQSYQGCTRLKDGLDVDGNGDMENPANVHTCDSDGDGRLDGSRLFSRPPLAVRLQIRYPAGLAGNELWVIVVHLKSRVEDNATQRYTEPRRIEQARFVAELAAGLHAAHPQAALAVLGDLNDLPASPALQALSNAGLESQISHLERDDRYTYIYHGLSQLLDDIWVYPADGWMWGAVGVAHINADFPVDAMKDGHSLYRSSDHDPGWVDLMAMAGRAYLPTVMK